MTVGERIKNRRTDLGMTQAISKYENNLINDIPRKKLAIIADALDCTPAFLLGFDEDAPSVEEARDELKDAQRILMSASSKLTVENVLLLARIAETLRED